MKKITTLLLCSLFLAVGACQDKKKDTSLPGSGAENSVIEVVAPTKMNAAIQNTDGIQLVDVRTETEYKVSHLKNAQNICVTDADFEEKAKSLNLDEPVYVYCRKGGRSAKAAKILKDMGFTQIYDLQGGILNWQDNDLEVTQ